MELAVDLHSHSSYAGGSGLINLNTLASAMRYKGINVFGVGDCQFPAWRKTYTDQLIEEDNGLYRYPNTKAYFIRQTEIIITVAIKDYKQRIVAHHVILFPDDAAVTKFLQWMQKYKAKNTIARPYLVYGNQVELETSLSELQDIDANIEIIPAHILTPDGILGSRNNLRHWDEFYGKFTSNIHAVETGLSADPQMLSHIPDLQDKAFISSSDCHSTALNKVGREFTILMTNELSYFDIIKAIRERKIKFTAEFPPAEGRYYLTGHRADRHKSGKAFYYEQETPENPICPICHKKMLTGVRDRAKRLSTNVSEINEQHFMHLIPLIEVLASALSVQSVANKKVQALYNICLTAFPSEIAIWQSPKKIIHELLDSKLPQEIVKLIIAVKDGKFCYVPPGYDGLYGKLKIRGDIDEL
ncbi:MAG TPA: endonuclease Q family protein [Candidatus Cloacimonadota bacterium]|nr:endonuclease Q family protein [Candidatus Cloacimonadota bacterium]HQL14955.1 endonuclease Q family protein [Candidatus Cloacimonadota bacterium]